MRILFDVPAFAMGGMERQIADLATGLVRRGHEVALVVNKDADDAYRGIVRSSGADVTVLGRTNRLDPRVLTDLLSIMRRTAPDVVVCETFNATLWGRVAGIASGAAIVVAEHSSDRRAPRKEYWSNRCLAPWTDAVVACARGQVPSLIADGHPKGAIVVVHNGVDTVLFHPDPEGGAALRAESGIGPATFVIGMVAAHRSEKRHDRLIALAETLSGTGADYVAVGVGGGPLLDSDRVLAAGSPASDRIRFVGPRSDMTAVYNACDLVVLLSDSVETFPLAFLEAQACGRPVAGMEVGGLVETFEPGVSGVLVEQGDIAAMAGAITGLMSDPAACRRMGQAGRSLMEERFTLDRMVDGYEAVLRGAVEAAADRRHAHGT
jgi:glycosyltransferase involved in cell wall biosynthesis